MVEREPIKHQPVSIHESTPQPMLELGSGADLSEGLFADLAEAHYREASDDFLLRIVKTYKNGKQMSHSLKCVLEERGLVKEEDK